MMRAMSSAVAGLKAQQTGMDVIGNNISNVNTSGFKASRVTYSDVYYSTLSGASAGSATSGGSNPSQIGYGSTVGSIDKSTGQNGYDSTSSAMDCYIDGDGYFAVADNVTVKSTTSGTGADAVTTYTDTEPTSYKYTRIGNLSFDSSGNLINGSKGLVCGYDPSIASADQTSGKTSPTTLNLSGAYVDGTATPLTLSDIKSISISKDGVISAVTSDGKTATIGTLAIANIPNASGMTQEGNSYYKATAASGDATYYAAGTGTTGSLVTSALETSNVDLATEFANMITTQRGFQANSKIITVSDTMLEELCDMKR
jgi:flagellar hook protein FlgE